MCPVKMISIIVLFITFINHTMAEHKSVKRSIDTVYPTNIQDLIDVPLPKPHTFNLGPWIPSSRLNGYQSIPTPMEVANAIALAKQASTNVLLAQKQVQAAKENVLNQQKIAAEKENQATILTQKSEVAAAIQRSEAAAAAQSVILAQKRLAAAKNAVSQQQRIAAAKEAQAAAALQSSAHAAAEEIQRTENEAEKLAALHSSGAAAAAHHLIATKDAIVSPLTTGTNNVPDIQFSLSALNPWINPLSSSGIWPSAEHFNGAATAIPKPAYNIWG